MTDTSTTDDVEVSRKVGDKAPRDDDAAAVESDKTPLITPDDDVLPGESDRELKRTKSELPEPLPGFESSSPSAPATTSQFAPTVASWCIEQADYDGSDTVAEILIDDTHLRARWRDLVREHTKLTELVTSDLVDFMVRPDRMERLEGCHKTTVEMGCTIRGIMEDALFFGKAMKLEDLQARCTEAHENVMAILTRIASNDRDKQRMSTGETERAVLNPIVTIAAKDLEILREDVATTKCQLKHTERRCDREVAEARTAKEHRIAEIRALYRGREEQRQLERGLATQKELEDLRVQLAASKAELETVKAMHAKHVEGTGSEVIGENDRKAIEDRNAA